MHIPIVYVIIGMLTLILGADFLVRGSVGLANRFRVRPLIIGLTIVAFGTSAPELAVSIKAALAGQGDVAAGNVIGSNIFNIAVILGLSAMVIPLSIHLRLLGFEIPLMIGVSLVGVVMLANQWLSRWEGIILFGGIIGYTVYTIWSARNEESEVDQITQNSLPSPPCRLWVDVLLIVVGLFALVFGAKWIVKGAIDLARMLNVSEAIIGLTIVAAGTSLPELATSLSAASKRQTDIAVGNIVGSNIFNILSILGLSAVIRPFRTSNLEMYDLVVMMIFAVVLLPFARSGFKLSRMEGCVMFFGYIGYVVFRLLQE
ncbi:MAG TPA: calcium/sodium antiporter [Kiritimatiellia bacterium]|nr:calcium/sodium antiporter [Kiritimatiellia bacterium]